MTPSEQRLHPASIVFDIARYARIFAWPALLAWMSGNRGRRAPGVPGVPGELDVSSFETWLWVLILPSVALSIVRFLTFRIHYGSDELVIRSGLLFRNVRHVPFARVQNLDAVQNPFHRALGVVDVRVETGSGSAEPEARLNVLPAAALDEMRARVFAGRADRLAEPPAEVTGAAAAGSPGLAGAEGAPVVHLSPRDLLLQGLLENKGMVLVGAAYGVLWEAGLMDWLWGGLFDRTLDARGLFRALGAFLLGRGPLPAERLALAMVGIAGALLLVRLISMVWALVRLWDFRLVRVGDDLRVTYGLLTRVTATIPVRRVQTITVQRGWLHRQLDRASIRVATAGGHSGAATRDREWLAPIIAESAVSRVLAVAMPGTLVAHDWQPVHARAFRRAVKPPLAVAVLIAAALAAALGWRSLVVTVPFVAWTVWSTRGHVRHLAWTVSDALVAYRSGWLSRSETLVRMNRIQCVALRQSPFDRRARMASLSVDTAGAGEFSHRVAIPYLDADMARQLQRRLAHAAASTEFQW